MMDRRAPWTSQFYDICDWFYWSPRTFNRLPDPANPEKGFPAVMRKIGRTEEALNYILRILFAIGPNRLISDILRCSTGQDWDDDFHVGGRDCEARYALPPNSTQPDFFFDGANTFITMEMKVGAKTYPNQLAKYLYLHVMAEKQGGRPKRHALVYLGPGDWPSLWKDKRDLSYAERLAEAVANAPKTLGMNRTPVDVEQLAEMASRIQLGYLSYQTLVDELLKLRSSISGVSWASEVAERLLDGAIHEIVRRKLASTKG